MEAGTMPGRRTATGDTDNSRSLVRRLSTETKHSTKTSEFWAFVVIVVGILVSAAAIKGGDSGALTGGTDEFIARNAWLYVSIVTGAYLISRGLAKAGSREPYDSDDH